MSAEADPRVVRALEAQLGRWKEALDAGARRVGWKIGLNIPEVQERLGLSEPVIGHLTSATQLTSGAVYSAASAVALRAEPEMALELGRDVGPESSKDDARGALAGLAPAIELVDTGRPPDSLEGIVAENVFHRAFTLGPTRSSSSAEGLTATISVNGQERASAPAPSDFAEVVLVVARHLASVGEHLLAGDRIIAGSLTEQLEVEPGDRIELEIPGLGRTETRIGP